MTILQTWISRKSMNLKESRLYIGGGGYPSMQRKTEGDAKSGSEEEKFRLEE